MIREVTNEVRETPKAGRTFEWADLKDIVLAQVQSVLKESVLNKKNDAGTRANVVQAVDAVIRPLADKGVVSGVVVVCDERNNDEETVAEGELQLQIGVRARSGEKYKVYTVVMSRSDDFWMQMLLDDGSGICEDLIN